CQASARASAKLSAKKCEARKRIVRLLASLEGANQALLRHTVCVLWHIATHAHVNKMSADNLGVCVGQSLLNEGHNNAVTQMCSTSPKAQEMSKLVPRLVAYLITNAVDLFGPQVIGLFGPPPVSVSSDGQFQEREVAPPVATSPSPLSPEPLQLSPSPTTAKPTSTGCVTPTPTSLTTARTSTAVTTSTTATTNKITSVEFEEKQGQLDAKTTTTMERPESVDEPDCYHRLDEHDNTTMCSKQSTAHSDDVSSVLDTPTPPRTPESEEDDDELGNQRGTQYGSNDDQHLLLFDSSSRPLSSISSHTRHNEHLLMGVNGLRRGDTGSCSVPSPTSSSGSNSVASTSTNTDTSNSFDSPTPTPTLTVDALTAGQGCLPAKCGTKSANRSRSSTSGDS
ncbi:Rho GTPase-activating protein 20, partial [Fragariocoptes setiger]